MQVILAIIVSVMLQTPMEVFIAPDCSVCGAVQCVQCDSWYMPETDCMWSCPDGCQD